MEANGTKTTTRKKDQFVNIYSEMINIIQAIMHQLPAPESTPDVNQQIDRLKHTGETHIANLRNMELNSQDWHALLRQITWQIQHYENSVRKIATEIQQSKEKELSNILTDCIQQLRIPTDKTKPFIKKLI